MSRVIESATGAQILPEAGAQRATVTAWAAASCVNADLRTKSREHAALAGRLIVETKEI